MLYKDTKDQAATANMTGSRPGFCKDYDAAHESRSHVGIIHACRFYAPNQLENNSNTKQTKGNPSDNIQSRTFPAIGQSTSASASHTAAHSHQTHLSHAPNLNHTFGRTQVDRDHEKTAYLDPGPKPVLRRPPSGDIHLE